MKKYSVLLVDDEEEVFQVIMKKLDWESMGFTIAGYAKNGVEALEMAEEILPDVVLTDIKMPYMDGLTLSKKLREQYQNLKIIIFSGFDEFEYAKEAIKIEAEEYILKPIDSGELRKVFERIRENLDRERDEKRNIDKLRDYYLESLPILQENFFTSLIEGRIPQEKMDQYLANYQIDLSSPYYIAAVLHCSTTDQQLDMDPILHTLAVKRLSEEELPGKWRTKIFSYLGDIVVLGQLESREQVTEFTDDLDRFCKLAKRVCNARVTAGVGYLCDKIEDLSTSYTGARSAISYRVFYGNTRAINIVEIDPQNSMDASWEEGTYSSKIFKAIKMGDRGAWRRRYPLWCAFCLSRAIPYRNTGL